jgi:sortase A
VASAPQLDGQSIGLTARRRRRVWRWAECLSWAGGLVAIFIWAGAGLVGKIGARTELRHFAELKSAAPLPDLSLWSPERIDVWRASFGQQSPAPLGVIRIRRINVEAPILEGTSEWALNRGVGHIEGTAAPGEPGNAGLAGHRDGFFRALKDVREGDTLELETVGDVATYRIERAWVVTPNDVAVLDETTQPSLTLVTCYPFYFVGSAPQRFIVRAVRIATDTKTISPAEIRPTSF